ncbi:MAG: hypothetical protein EOP38_12320 [Rubrivivax sp.]|nr:MAG: hypothetical protein EOP38_12320 [Rubrivivax sp.]
MATSFDRLSTHLSTAWKPRKAPVAPRAYRCQCGRPIFFRNSRCLNCQTPLGYEPFLTKVVPLQAGEAPDSWTIFGTEGAQAQHYRRCANLQTAAACNWLIPQATALQDDADTPSLCTACRLNRTIPDLSVPGNDERWHRMEIAKRRLISQLIALHLPVASKVSEDPEHGLAYDFLATPDGGQRVLTGHDSGLMTLNIDEADDATRERTREEMKEPYRTLLGHFRHEIGHYYWDRLVDHTDWLAPFRQLFGDERQDYGEALAANYRDGPPADWPTRFVSAYASTHPWEDWAETWAHYLHMVDTVDTALSFGIDADNVEVDAEPYDADDLWNPKDPDGQAFLNLINAWVELSAVMNEMSRAMGQADFYPFVLPHVAIRKLHFIHCVVSAHAGKAASGA